VREADVRGQPIAIVHPEPVFLGLMETALRDAGYCPHPIADAGAALQTIKKERPGLVIMDRPTDDLGRPGLLQSLRSNEITQAIPVIVATSSGGVDARPAADPQDPTVRLLYKPFSLDDLLSAVRDIVGPSEKGEAEAARSA
jgi:DNA-binding NtrC family response regulator